MINQNRHDVHYEITSFGGDYTLDKVFDTKVEALDHIKYLYLQYLKHGNDNSCVRWVIVKVCYRKTFFGDGMYEGESTVRQAVTIVNFREVKSFLDFVD